MPKRLTKSATNAKLFGVCGGIGEYFNIDPVIIRVLVVVATMMTGVWPGIIAYIACGLIMPTSTEVNRDYNNGDNQN